MYKYDKRIVVTCFDCNITKEISLHCLQGYKRKALKNGTEYKYRCHKCALRHASSGEKNNNWNGGKFINEFGYVALNIRYLSEEDKKLIGSTRISRFFPEHRLIMAKKLGRQLSETELVHHINGIKTDNRIENLSLIDPITHRAITTMESKWEKRIKDLEEENAKLKEQLFELVE